MRHRRRASSTQSRTRRRRIAVPVLLSLIFSACGANAAREPSPTRSPREITRGVPATARHAVLFPRLHRRARARVVALGLVRAAPPQLLNACARTVAKTRWTVLCPGRVPGGRLAVITFGVSGRSSDFRQGYMLSFQSGALRTAGAPDPGHWTFAVGTRGALRDQLTARGRSAPVGERHLRVGGVRVTRYREPEFGSFPGLYGGHVVYEWTVGRTTLQVSVHGQRHERVLRGLVRLLATAPDLAPPTPPSPSGSTSADPPMRPLPRDGARRRR